ncbi:Ig-like domain-containing protein [Rarobacter incanus]|uniref:Ig-like protein group 2 n=1 Tax=Rarobacter incanus TaxID=153494 RepID=A0A542SN10_9MICO|nr:Ig-like domain-containing protein [Rarobacter incanus]TQK76013.1 Ig-like protein group 2 [Rarobacter incanus]
MSEVVPTAEPSARLRRRWTFMTASLAVTVLAVGALLAAPPQAADSAIAGVTKLLDVPQASITKALPSCDFADYCASYNVTLSAGSVVQFQTINPTNSLTLKLYDSFKTETDVVSSSANSSDWANFSVENDDTVGLGVTPVLRSGRYTLVVGSNYQLVYGLYAFTIPNTLKIVSLGSTTKGEFTDKSTRRISGKYTNYSDGVAFNARKGDTVTITFKKVTDTEATVTLYDSFRNQLTYKSDWNGTAQIADYKIPFDGLFQVMVAGKTTGKFSIKIAKKQPYVAVKKVKLSKKKVTLRLKKNKRTIKIKAKVTPSNASDKKVTWTSSNTRVAKVSKGGKITAKRVGKATITATTRDGAKRAVVKVKVKKR